MKPRVLALLLLGSAAVAGCETYPHGDVEVGVGEPVAYDTYYVGGYYDGPYWVWTDHDGHRYRERREHHERRIAEHDHHEHGEHEHGENR